LSTKRKENEKNEESRVHRPQPIVQPHRSWRRREEDDDDDRVQDRRHPWNRSWREVAAQVGALLGFCLAFQEDMMV